MTEDGGRKTSSHASHPFDGKNQNVTPACSTFLTQILNELVFVDPGRGAILWRRWSCFWIRQLVRLSASCGRLEEVDAVSNEQVWVPASSSASASSVSLSAATSLERVPTDTLPH